MSGPNPEELTTIGQGQSAKRMLAILDEEEARIRKEIIAEVAAIIEKGETLTPQFAIQKWIEFVASEQYAKKLRRRVKHGRQSAEQVAARSRGDAA